MFWNAKKMEEEKKKREEESRAKAKAEAAARHARKKAKEAKQRKEEEEKRRREEEEGKKEDSERFEDEAKKKEIILNRGFGFGGQVKTVQNKPQSVGTPTFGPPPAGQRQEQTPQQKQAQAAKNQNALSKKRGTAVDTTGGSLGGLNSFGGAADINPLKRPF